jgi:chitinase
MGTTSAFGSTDEQIRANIKKAYNNQGIKLLISAFGSTETPTTSGYNPNTTANALASFVSTMNLDGVDVDWEDT